MRQDGTMAGRARLLAPLLWIALLTGWTWALLLPVPAEAEEVVGGPENLFTLGKALHVSVYAALAVLTAYLPLALPRRILLTLMLLAHGALTEYLQQFVGRGASARDVFLDALGVLLGVLLVLQLRRHRERRRRLGAGVAPAQKPLQQDRCPEHQQTADL
jgi:VanZ family protein